MSGGATPSEIRGFFDEAERLAAKAREVREGYAAIAKRAKDKEIAWTQLKALATAHDADKHPPEGKKSNKVGKLVASREYACWYAEILRLGQDEHVVAIRSSTLTPTHASVSGVEGAADPPAPSPDSESRGDGESGPVADIRGSITDAEEAWQAVPVVRAGMATRQRLEPRAGVAPGPRDTEIGEGPTATLRNTLSVPLVTAVGDRGDGETAATLDDPYNADVRTTIFDRTGESVRA